MKRLFITGIPAAGKSHLAKIVAEKTGGIVVSLDDLRESLASDPHYAPWVNFYIEKDEEAYYRDTSPADQWKNLVAQSEALWPAFLEKIRSYDTEKRPVIFECVNILPHLAKRDLDFPGIVLIGSSHEEILKRNMENPRWGNTKHLQELEADSFFTIERPQYQSEAKKYGYPVFETADAALPEALRILGGL
ncbi:MAG TPA: hypothetical protein VFT82_01430 [Candidatus Paceibacterota bacterium]|nr:hypothetical protein [Candidatus Paceibacterota bacterium]